MDIVPTSMDDTVHGVYEMLVMAVDRENELETRIGAKADGFNRLLRGARQCFPDSAVLAQMPPLREADIFALLIARLSLLKGVLDAEIVNATDVLSLTFELWKQASGEYWAVQLVGTKVAGCFGPLHPEDRQRWRLPYLAYTLSTEWLEQHRHEFA